MLEISIKDLLKQSIERKLLWDLELASKIENFLGLNKITLDDKLELVGMMQTYPEVQIEISPTPIEEVMEQVELNNQVNTQLSMDFMAFMDWYFTTHPEEV